MLFMSILMGNDKREKKKKVTLYSVFSSQLPLPRVPASASAIPHGKNVPVDLGLPDQARFVIFQPIARSSVTS